MQLKIRMFSLFILLICLVLPLSLFAATTGKISGRVVDAETGEPLPGANITIVGTNFGAATDPDGYYFIINIRPGKYDLRTTMMGYQTLEKTDVSVFVDQTTPVNFDLKQTVISGEVVTVVAEREIVPLDVSSSQQVLQPEQIENTVYHNLANVMSAQVGIAGFGTNAATPRIRGSDYRDGEFNVDGMSLVDEISNRPYMKINLGAVQEIKVITGGYPAEYGNVRSGMINIVTKEGSDRYTGTVDFKYSPSALKHFGPMMYGGESPIVKPFTDPAWGAFSGKLPDGSDSQFFPGWEKYSSETLKPGDPHYGNPYENLALYLWRHRSNDNLKLLEQLIKEGKVDADLNKVDFEKDNIFDYGDRPDYVGELSFGGPMPFLNSVKFFLSHRVERSAYARTFPSEFYRDQLSSLKLTSNLTEAMKLNVNLLYGWQMATTGDQGPGMGSHLTNNPFNERSAGFEGDVNDGYAAANKMWYPNCNVPGIQQRYSLGVQFTHVLSPSTFYEITFNHLLTDEESVMMNRNTIKIENSPWGLSHLKYGRLGTEAYADSMAAAGVYDWNNWRNYAKIRIGDYWYDEAPWGYGPVNWRDLTGEYRMESCNVRENESMFRKYVLKGALTSQFNRFNQLKAGFEIQHDRIHGEYKAIDPSVNGGSWDYALANPWSVALFVQDKLEFRGMIANVGIRMDAQFRDKMVHQFSPDMIGDDGRLVLPDDPLVGPFTPYLQQGYKTVIDDSLNWERVTKVKFSPRLGISHPISQDAKIFFNYGHFYRWPSAWDLYRYTMQATEGFRIQNRGNPELDPPRTIQYEVGYAHNLFDMIELTINGYYKDISDELGEVRFYPLEGKETRIYINNTYRDIRGIELEADMRYGRYISGFANLDYMISSRGYYGYDRFYEDPNQQSRQITSDVTQPLARPVFKLNVDFHTPPAFGPEISGIFPLADMNINLLYTWRDGEKFTWNPNGIPYVEDNIKWRPYQRTDLRFTKRLFKKWGIEPVFYVDVINVFNNKNMITPGQYNYNNSVNRVLTGINNNWTWNDHRWWNNEFKDYMNSLDLTINEDGSITGPDRPGDYPKDGKRQYIKMPAFTPWTFLEKRDIFFGIKINFY